MYDSPSTFVLLPARNVGFHGNGISMGTGTTAIESRIGLRK